jgi:DNA-binding NarL/FixJ family response regulator
MSRARILLADDHAILLDAFRKLLEPTYEVVGAVTNGQALLKVAQALQPDVILSDITMPLLNGLDAAERLQKLVPNAKLVFLTVNEDPDLAVEAVRRGASGYLLKKSASAELFEAIRQVLRGRAYITTAITTEPSALFVAKAREGGAAPGLSLRQREVLQLLAEGKSMKEAGDVLGLTPRTIAFHKYAMMQHLGVKTSAELVQHAMKLGLVAGRAG